MKFPVRDQLPVQHFPLPAAGSFEDYRFSRLKSECFGAFRQFIFMLCRIDNIGIPAAQGGFERDVRPAAIRRKLYLLPSDQFDDFSASRVLTSEQSSSRVKRLTSTALQ